MVAQWEVHTSCLSYVIDTIQSLGSKPSLNLLCVRYSWLIVKIIICIIIGKLLCTKNIATLVSNNIILRVIIDVNEFTLMFYTSCDYKNSPVNIWYDLKQIATEFFFAGMHSGEVSLKHTKNPLRHLWGKQVKSAIKVTFSH